MLASAVSNEKLIVNQAIDMLSKAIDPQRSFTFRGGQPATGACIFQKSISVCSNRLPAICWYDWDMKEMSTGEVKPSPKS